MKHISIVVPNGPYSVVNIGGAFQILNWANDAYFRNTRKPLFKIDLVGENTPVNDMRGLYKIATTRQFSDITSTDLVILPAVHEDVQTVLQNNPQLVPWIQQMHHEGSQLAAFCIGSFILAETGLLDGKECSTHWAEAESFQKTYPKVQVKSENLVTDHQGIYTCGGAYAFTNLVIYLIEKLGGRELAIMTSKAFMIEMARNNQSQFMIFNGQKGHGDDLVLQIQQEIEDKFEQKLSVDELTTHLSITRRTAERRFRDATGNSILEYLQRVRVENAKKVLEHTQGNVSEAMYSSGYSDPKSFREIFNKYVGINPIDYRNRFLRTLN